MGVTPKHCTIEFIHGRIVHERDAGTAVLVISSELDEVVALADRIAVMYLGRILAIVSPDTPREDLGLLMAGITEPGARVRDASVPGAGPGPAAGTGKPAAPGPADDADGAAEKGTK